MAHDLTPEELDGLTEEERKAIEADDDESDKLPINREVDDEGDDDADTGDAADEGDVTPKGDDASRAERDKPETGSATDTSDEQPFVHAYTAPAVEDYDGKRAALEAKKDEAFQKLMDGEITAEEYRTTEKAAAEELDTLRDAKVKSDIASETLQQKNAAEWAWQCSRFIKSAKTSDGIDYSANKILLTAFDTAVRDLANDPANSSKGAEFFLGEAHKQVKAAFGLTATKPAPTAKAKVEREAPDLSKLPPTLAKVPVAQEGAVTGDEFSYMKSLKGDAYEKAIARMDDAQLARFMG